MCLSHGYLCRAAGKSRLETKSAFVTYTNEFFAGKTNALKVQFFSQPIVEEAQAKLRQLRPWADPAILDDVLSREQDDRDPDQDRVVAHGRPPHGPGARSGN